MLRRWSSCLQATAGTNGASVRLLHRRARGPSTEVAVREVACGGSPAEWPEVIEALDRALGDLAKDGNEIAGLRCDVAVSDAWMVYEVLGSDLSDLPRREANELAAAALADTAGLRQDEIVVRWRRQGRSSIACALPRTALLGLQATLHRHQVRLGSVHGQLVLAYNARKHALEPAATVLAVARAGGTQLGLLVDAGFAATRFEPSAQDATALIAHSRSLMRSAGYEPDERTRYYADTALQGDDAQRWSCDVEPAHWMRSHVFDAAARLDLDLSPARTRVLPTSWVLLAAGLLAITVAGLQFQTASGKHLREARALERLEASLSEAKVADARNVSPQEARSVRGSAAVVRELRVPWGKLFAALEAVASQNIALLSVEPSAQRQEIRIVAEAKSSAAMIDFLEALRAQSLQEVVLVSHQVQSQTPGTPLRFHARARWEAQ